MFFNWDYSFLMVGHFPDSGSQKNPKKTALEYCQPQYSCTYYCIHYISDSSELRHHPASQRLQSLVQFCCSPASPSSSCTVPPSSRSAVVAITHRAYEISPMVRYSQHTYTTGPPATTSACFAHPSHCRPPVLQLMACSFHWGMDINGYQTLSANSECLLPYPIHDWTTPKGLRSAPYLHGNPTTDSSFTAIKAKNLSSSSIQNNRNVSEQILLMYVSTVYWWEHQLLRYTCNWLWVSACVPMWLYRVSQSVILTRKVTAAIKLQ